MRLHLTHSALSGHTQSYVVMIGVNNLLRDTGTPAQIAGGLQLLVDLLVASSPANTPRVYICHILHVVNGTAFEGGKHVCPTELPRRP
jgi:hypothetical protein